MEHHIYTLQYQEPANLHWKPDDKTVASVTYASNRSHYRAVINKTIPSDVMAPFSEQLRSNPQPATLYDRYILVEGDQPDVAPLARIDIHQTGETDTPWQADSSISPWLTPEQEQGVVIALATIGRHLKEIEDNARN